MEDTSMTTPTSCFLFSPLYKIISHRLFTSLNGYACVQLWPDRLHQMLPQIFGGGSGVIVVLNSSTQTHFSSWTMYKTQKRKEYVANYSPLKPLGRAGSSSIYREISNKGEGRKDIVAPQCFSKFNNFDRA